MCGKLPKINYCAANNQVQIKQLPALVRFERVRWEDPPQTSVWRQGKRAALLAQVQVRLAFGPVKADGPAAGRAVKRNRLVVHHGPV